ncbi:MAG: PilZ domain-containing protein [Pseudomonadota bacterium]
MSDSNKRAAFRVTEAVRLAFEPVAEQDWHERMSMLAVSASSIQNAKSAVADVSLEIQRKMIAAHRVSETISTCLELLNKKMDLLVEQVVTLQEQQGEFADVPIRRCEISANGVRFSTRRGLEKGSRLHLKMMLVTDSFYFEVLGEVVRDEPDPEAEDRKVVAIRFRGIREPDKDRLIKHLLSRQSETIRARRLRLEAVAEMEEAEGEEVDI